MFPEGRVFELLIAATVALIVVGPKDLPVLLRKFGQFMAKVRSMAAEFRASFDEMARQSELDELRKEVEAMRQGQLGDAATHAPEVNQAFNEISQGLSDVGVDLNVATSMPYVAAQTSHIEEAPTAKPRPRKATVKGASVKRKSASAKSTQTLKPTSKPPGNKLPAKTAAKPASKTVSKTSVKAVASPSQETLPVRPRTRRVSAS